VTKIVPTVTEKTPIVTSTVTKPTVTSTVTRAPEKNLRFNSTMKMEERIGKYLDLYPDSRFIPNWIAHGFNSKEEAIKKAISDVKKNSAVISTGLDGK
jgi:hypothetical protein